jgi:hypothetical protein
MSRVLYSYICTSLLKVPSIFGTQTILRFFRRGYRKDAVVCIFYNEAPGGVDSPNGIMFFRCLSSSEKSISSSENNARATQLYVWL